MDNIIAWLIVACIGTWGMADGLSSLWAYTGDSRRAKHQTFWRDHALRCFRMLLGFILIILAGIQM